MVPLETGKVKVFTQKQQQIYALRRKVLSGLPAEPLGLMETMGPLQSHVPDAFSSFSRINTRSPVLGFRLSFAPNHKTQRPFFVCVRASKAHLLGEKERARVNGNTAV